MRTEYINHLYELLEKINEKFPQRKLEDLPKSKKDIPIQGVYFFFEEGEFREHSNVKRVVRIGTHAAQAGSKATIKKRLQQHMGPKHLMGKHRSSVFRELIGYSLISKNKLDMKYWGNRAEKSNKPILQSEEELEKEVSCYLKNMSFTILEVPGPASKDNDRAFIERNSIALLSNYNREIIDPASQTWLAKSCGKEKIIKSGLWNSNYVDIDLINPHFIDKMEHYVNEMKNYSEYSLKANH